MLSKVILQGFSVVPDSDLEVVKRERELITHKRLTLNEAGCLTFTVTQNEADLHKFSVYEALVNQAAFDNYQARVNLSKWSEVTKNVARNYKISSGHKRITNTSNGKSSCLGSASLHYWALPKVIFLATDL